MESYFTSFFDMSKQRSMNQSSIELENNGTSEGATDGTAEANKSNQRRTGLWDAIVTPVEEDRRAIEVFNILHILSGSFLIFTHGSTDTANAVGPLVGMWMVYKSGLATTPAADRPDIQLLISFGAIGQVIGFIVLGHRVMATLGKDITEVTAPSGFCVELGAVFTTLIASKVGIPVSTTHCAVGAVVFVGFTRTCALRSVAWDKFRDIFVFWLITLPVSGVVAAFVAYLLGHFVLATV